VYANVWLVCVESHTDGDEYSDYSLAEGGDPLSAVASVPFCGWVVWNTRSLETNTHTHTHMDGLWTKSV
jgi:hypothetical protein